MSGGMISIFTEAKFFRSKQMEFYINTSVKCHEIMDKNQYSLCVTELFAQPNNSNFKNVFGFYK